MAQFPVLVFDFPLAYSHDGNTTPRSPPDFLDGLDSKGQDKLWTSCGNEVRKLAQLLVFQRCFCCPVSTQPVNVFVARSSQVKSGQRTCQLFRREAQFKAADAWTRVPAPSWKHDPSPAGPETQLSWSQDKDDTDQRWSAREQ